VKRECYTLGSVEGQTEKTLGVRGGDSSKIERILPSSRCNLRQRMRDPSRLVPFAPEGNRREIRRIRFNEQTIPRYKSHQIVIRPLVERYDPAERNVPSRVERELGQRMRTRVTVHDPEGASGTSIANDGAGVVFRISRVDNQRLAELGCEPHLGGERRALGFPRRIVVVIVESALADRHRWTAEQLAKFRNVARRLEGDCVVGMDSGGRKNKARIVDGVLSRERRRGERFPNADDRSRARFAGARDYRVAVAGERRVREVGVAVDEDWRVLVVRGHLRSIQRSTGAAT
jgi:hypothetical protein